MITRHDLTHQHLHSALHHKQEAAAKTAAHAHDKFGASNDDGVLDPSYRSSWGVDQDLVEDETA